MVGLLTLMGDKKLLATLAIKLQPHASTLAYLF